MSSYYNKPMKSKLISIFLAACFCLALSGRLYSAEGEPNQDKKPLRDPMMPFDMSIFEITPQKATIKRSPFKVQGLGRSDKAAYVIIGGKVYQEGETKGGVTVVKITGTAVDILVDGQPETLLVKEK